MSRSTTRQLSKALSTNNLQTTNQVTQNRPYVLNRQKALDKKLENCLVQHVKYEMKAGKNFVIVFSTAAYELAKTVLADIFNSEEFSDNYAIQTQKGIDRSNSTIDLCYKILNRKNNGQFGNQLKFTINCYNSTNTMTVNGNRVDIFVNDTFEELCKTLKSNFNSLDVINQNISSQLCAAKSTTGCIDPKPSTMTSIESVRNNAKNQQTDRSNTHAVAQTTTTTNLKKKLNLYVFVQCVKGKPQ